ncbi:MAG: addiction module protein [Longimicrobiales bacterium]
MAHRLFDFSHLTPAERIELAVALWDSLPDDSTEPPLTEAQRTELMHRLDAYQQDPEAGSSWKEAQERIRSRFHRKP